MVKITSKSWVEKDDPMFTGRFYVHSKIKKNTAIQNNKNKDKIKKNKS